MSSSTACNSLVPAPNDDPGPLLVFGAGGHGRVVLDSALAAGLPVAMLIDRHPTVAQVYGVPVAETFPFARFRFLVAIGDNADRRRVFAELRARGGQPVNVIHPSAAVSPHAQLGHGVFVCAGAAINAGAVIGDNCIVNTSASVDHDCAIGEHTHLAPGVRLGGDVRVGAECLLGIGAAVLPGLSIGDRSVVGAGSVVTRDLPGGIVAFGAPACVRRRHSGRAAAPQGAMRVLATGEEREWNAVLARCAQHDFYHQPRYHALSELMDRARANLFVFGEGEHVIALPLLLRELSHVPGLADLPAPAGWVWRDATCVYGYSGPVASSPDLPPEVIARFQAALRGASRSGTWSVFSRGCTPCCLSCRSWLAWESPSSPGPPSRSICSSHPRRSGRAIARITGRT